MKTLTKTTSIIAALTIGLFVTSCKKDNVDATSASSTFNSTSGSASVNTVAPDPIFANVQYVNASPDAGSSALYISNVFKGIDLMPYGKSSGYFVQPPSIARIPVAVKNAQGDTIRTTSSGFFSNAYYSVYLVGEKANKNVNILITTDNQPAIPPANGMIKLKFVNAAPSSPVVDVVANGKVIISGQGYKGITFYQDYTSGSYNLKLYAHGTTTELANLSTMNMQSGKIYTVFAKDDMQGSKVKLALDVFANN